MANIVRICLTMLVVLALPILGLFISGKPISEDFNPLPIPLIPGERSLVWGIFAIGVSLVALTLIPFIRRFGSFSAPSDPPIQANHKLPWWGWGGGLWVLGGWTLAWSRFGWMEPIQPHTFPILWFGYILLINSLTFQRKRQCLMLNHPKFFGKLFLLSAGFWWAFEYLNQFVQNWHYIGIPTAHVWEARIWMTIAFSTVLPAVLGTLEYLASFPRLATPFQKWHAISIFDTPNNGWIFFLIGSLGLLTIGLWPTILFPLLWVSPLLIFVGLRMIFWKRTLFSSLASGNWVSIVLPALAALICGGFWEMWNAYSMVHWEYTIPYVHAFQVFQMPLLGYAGYLPFGLECVVIVEVCFGHTEVNHILASSSLSEKITGDF